MAEEKLQLQLAIIRHPSFGCYDTGKCVLVFETYIGENTASTQVISAKDAIEIIEEYGVKDVHNLDGKPCWVETDGVNSILFAKSFILPLV